MRYIVFLLNAGTVGTDSAEFVEFDNTVTDDELSEEAWERAQNHAEMYGIYPMSSMPDDYDEETSDWRSDEYSDDIEGTWAEYNPEKHDGLIVGNGPAFENYNPTLADVVIAAV